MEQELRESFHKDLLPRLFTLIKSSQNKPFLDTGIVSPITIYAFHDRLRVRLLEKQIQR
jgi:hypothetical protein